MSNDNNKITYPENMMYPDPGHNWESHSYYSLWQNSPASQCHNIALPEAEADWGLAPRVRSRSRSPWGRDWDTGILWCDNIVSGVTCQVSVCIWCSWFSRTFYLSLSKCRIQGILARQTEITFRFKFVTFLCVCIFQSNLFKSLAY